MEWKQFNLIELDWKGFNLKELDGNGFTWIEFYLESPVLDGKGKNLRCFNKIRLKVIDYEIFWGF